MSEGAAAEQQQARPRLQLKPRDESAAKALELQRQSSIKNVFGDAKPREAVLASRTGKSETEILKEEVKAEKPKLRLNAQQLEEKRAAEAALDEIKELISAATSESSKEQLQEELSARQAQLDELMAGFEKLALEAAKTGEFVRPSERRRQQMLETQGSLGSNGYPMVGGGTGDPARDAAGGYAPRGGGGGGYGGRGGGGYGGGGFRGEGGGYREPRPGGFGGGGGGGYERRGGYGGRGGFDRGGRGFGNYDERGSFEERGGGYQERGGGYQERGGGFGYDRDERRSYEARDYRGPSDYDNVETFGLGAAGYGRDRARGGGRGGGRGRGFGGYGTGSFDREEEFVQDRY